MPLEPPIEGDQVQLSLTVEPGASMGLLINTSKTEYMTFNCPGNKKLKVLELLLSQKIIMLIKSPISNVLLAWAQIPKMKHFR